MREHESNYNRRYANFTGWHSDWSEWDWFAEIGLGRSPQWIFTTAHEIRHRPPAILENMKKGVLRMESVLNSGGNFIREMERDDG